MKSYILTLVAGILAIIVNCIAYTNNLSNSIKFWIALISCTLITAIAIYELYQRNKQERENLLFNLITAMKHHITNVFLTNGTGTDWEKKLEAEELNEIFADKEEKLRITAISQVLKVDTTTVKKYIETPSRINRAALRIR